MTKEQYWKAKAERQRIIRLNAGRRLKKLGPLELPPKPAKPIGYEIVDTEGDYVGFTMDLEDASDYVKDNGGSFKAKSPNWA